MKQVLVFSLLLFSLYGITQPKKYLADRDPIYSKAASIALISFQKENPQVQDAHWSKDGNGWNVNYRDDSKRNVDVHYNKDGICKDVHRSLDRMDVPRTLQSRIKQQYGGNYRVIRIERSNEYPIFEVRVWARKNDHIVYFNEIGRDKNFVDQH